MQPKLLKLHDSFLPQKERLEYRLEMFGAKGSVVLEWEKTDTLATLKCQVLASLVLPPKKLVDSEMTSYLHKQEDGHWKLVKHLDNDFKTEIKRHFELKEKLIETKYIKFDEERGYIDYPESSAIDSIFDPLLAIYLLRNPELQRESKIGTARVLLRTGILDLSCTLADTETYQLLSVKSIGGVKARDPFLSPDARVVLDASTGIITEITYPMIGKFGKLRLKLHDKS